jgi:acylphosphatase
MLPQDICRAEIRVAGRVQGVGFRYFVLREAEQGGVVGWTQNLSSGEVLTVAEGTRAALEKLAHRLQQGPPAAQVLHHSVEWGEAQGEFVGFSVRR